MNSITISLDNFLSLVSSISWGIRAIDENLFRDQVNHGYCQCQCYYARLSLAILHTHFSVGMCLTNISGDDARFLKKSFGHCIYFYTLKQVYILFLFVLCTGNHFVSNLCLFCCFLNITLSSMLRGGNVLHPVLLLLLLLLWLLSFLLLHWFLSVVQGRATHKPSQQCPSLHSTRRRPGDPKVSSRDGEPSLIISLSSFFSNISLSAGFQNMHMSVQFSKYWEHGDLSSSQVNPSVRNKV